MCAAGGDLLGQHGPVRPAAERRRALCHRCDAAAGAAERDLRRAVSAAVRPAEAAAPPARYLVLRGQWDLQPDAVFLVLFYGDAGCEPRGHGCASLYRAGVRHADEHRVLPGKADGGEADGAGFVPGGLRAGVGRGLVGAARAAGAAARPRRGLRVRAVFDLRPLCDRPRLQLVDDHVLHLRLLLARLRAADRLAPDRRDARRAAAADRVGAGHGAADRLSGLYPLHEGPRGHAVEPGFYPRLGRAGHVGRHRHDRLP